MIKTLDRVRFITIKELLKTPHFWSPRAYFKQRSDLPQGTFENPAFLDPPRLL